MKAVCVIVSMSVAGARISIRNLYPIRDPSVAKGSMLGSSDSLAGVVH